MEVEELIKEMQAVKAAHTSLEVQDVLRIFNIKALQELMSQVRRLAEIGR